MSNGTEGLSIVAVDTGGTFTDVVLARDGELRVLKLPSTPDDPARAVLEGIRRVLAAPPEHAAGDQGSGTRGRAGQSRSASDAAPAAPEEERRNPTDAPPSPDPRPPTAGPQRDDAAEFILVHGSTVATNALLERDGARVALVTNRGFEDALEIGRQDRPQLYALVGRRPPPLVARAHRHGIRGRLGPDGGQIEPLDAAELAALPQRLADADAVAVCLLHSYANPEHEHEVEETLKELGVPLSISADLLPEYREYERMATTVVNAYVAPRMERYLSRLEAESGAERVRVMGSGGGAVPVARARSEPVYTVLSGPAGGVMGALDAATAAGVERIITFDMGGTSTDVSLCPGRPLHTREFAIAGLPVAIPVIDIHTVGAGGGSLAWIDAGGALRVGPRSAGADPGPICYGRGGTEITVTDAHVWLGRLPAGAFLGGDQRLERERIEAPLRRLAERLGMTPEAAAEGVLAVADTAMERALRVISVDKGYDPEEFTLVPFGGAAALHAVALADRLGVPRLFVPPDPGVLSAHGMQRSPVRKDTAATVLIAADDAAAGELEDRFRPLEARALRAMADEGVDADRVELRHTIDARYHGQSYELRVPASDWVDAFHATHESRYGYARRDAVVEAVTLRVEATAAVPNPTRPPLPTADAAAEPVGTEDVVHGSERLLAPRYSRDRLRAGHGITGPAIVTEYSATVWLPPGWHARVEPGGGMLLERAADTSA